MSQGWIGVDFDGTLVTHEFPEIGEPIWPMINRVKAWLAEGKEVRVFTARVCIMDGNLGASIRQTKIVQDWCQEIFGERLPVTATKDYHMIELWDDRAIQVEKNTGRRMDGVE